MDVKELQEQKKEMEELDALTPPAQEDDNQTPQETPPVDTGDGGPSEEKKDEPEKDTSEEVSSEEPEGAMSPEEIQKLKEQVENLNRALWQERQRLKMLKDQLAEKNSTSFASGEDGASQGEVDPDIEKAVKSVLSTELQKIQQIEMEMRLQKFENSKERAISKFGEDTYKQAENEMVKYLDPESPDYDEKLHREFWQHPEPAVWLVQQYRVRNLDSIIEEEKKRAMEEARKKLLEEFSKQQRMPSLSTAGGEGGSSGANSLRQELDEL